MEYFEIKISPECSAPENGQAVLKCFIQDKQLNAALGTPDIRRPTVVILPGGGYTFVSPRECDPIAFQYLAAGFTVFALEYSVVPSVFPQALFEVYSALSLIRENAEKWGVDTDKIALIGFSAGGHLAASAGAFWDSDFVTEHFNGTAHKPNALVLSYPVISGGSCRHAGSFKSLFGTPDGQPTPNQLKAMSIDKQVTTNFPKTFIWHTFEDATVPVQNSLLLAGALAEVGTMFELHIYPQGAHGLSLSNHYTSKPGSTAPEKPRQWVKDSIDFLLNNSF